MTLALWIERFLLCITVILNCMFWVGVNERIRDLFWCLYQNSYGGVRKTSMEIMSFSEPKFEHGTLEL